MIPSLPKVVGTLIRESLAPSEITTAFDAGNSLTITHKNGLTLEIFDASQILSEPKREDIELLVFFKPHPNPYKTGLVVKLSDCGDMNNATHS